MRLDPSERINPEPISCSSSSSASSDFPLWAQITLGIVLGGIVLFLCWIGYHKYQEYRLARALEAAAQGFQQSLQRMNEDSRQAAIERRHRLEAENRAREQRLEARRLQMEQDRIAREAQLEAGRDRAEYMRKLADPKCQFWLDNLRTTGSDKAKIMVDYHCPE